MSRIFSYFIRRTNPTASSVRIKYPTIIRNLEKPLKLINISGLIISASTPTTIMEIVYNARLSKSAIVTTAVGILSSIMKKALAGWPPVADGVIAEKYISAAE